MKKIIFSIVFLFIGCNSSHENSSYQKNMILPVYFYDKSLWSDVSNSDLNNMYVIVNPNSGPGDTVDSNYDEFISDLVSNNKLPIGYVYTKWGSRNINEVKNDIDTWISFYPKIKGFFLDETSNNDGNFSYYQELSNYIKSKGNYYIVLNPATSVSSKYFDIADLIVVYEDSYTNFNNDVCNNENYLKSAVIVYDANNNDMKSVIKSKCKYYYITDDNLSNLYNSLPTYYNEEITLLK